MVTSCLHKFGQSKGYCAEIIEVGYYSYWCSTLGIEFNLQSNPDTDGVYCFDGWEDYFDPLIKTVKSSAIACRLNANVNSPLKQSLLPIRRKALKLLHPDFSYFTFDFNEIACRFACQACSSPINVRAEIRKHFNKIYSLNSSVTSRVQERKRSLQVSSPYCVFHIRRGDKIIEASYVEIQKYISRYKALFPKLDVPIYLMTDSVSVVDTCLARLPSDLVFGHSVLPIQQTGYDQATFNSLPQIDRYKNTLEIIIDLEIARGSEFFFGTPTSNIFGLLNYLHPLDISSLVNVGPA